MVVSLARWLASALIALTLTGCAAQPGKPVDWHERDSYSGWVTDAATGKPIEGAVVVAVWQILRRNYMFIAEGNPDREVIRLEETLTNKEGRFQFAPLGDYTPPIGWIRDEAHFPDIAFFKPSYEPTYRDRFTWEFGEQADISPRSAAAQTPKKDGWEREVQLYRYLTRPLSQAQAVNPIYKRLTENKKIEGLLRGFASGLANNVQYSDSPGASPESRPRRRAVEAQWRAIVMIDREIRKYQPHYQWGGSAIMNALKETQKREAFR